MKCNPDHFRCLTYLHLLKAVPEATQPVFTLRKDRVQAVTPSWQQWYEDREVDEWIMDAAAVSDQGWNDA